MPRRPARSITSQHSRDLALAIPPRPILSLVLDRSCMALALEETVEAAVRGGVDWIQIRERELDSASLLALSQQVKAAALRGATGRSVKLLVNRRIDIALALPADGAHLGFDAVTADCAKGLLPSSSLLGYSAHSSEEVKAAAASGATYAHLAPIFAPLSKASTRAALGVDALQAACGHGIAVIAQGGVTAANCREIVIAGAAGVAVTGAILQSSDPEVAAAELRKALDA